MQYTKQTLGNIVDQKCTEFAARESMVFASDNSRYTYSEFKILYDSLAKALLHLGIQRGQHIAIMSVNSPYWLAMQVAVSKIGAVLVCLNTACSAKELEYELNHSDSVAVILAGGKSKTPFLTKFQAICPEIQHSKPGELNSAALPLIKTVITDEATASPGVYTLKELAIAGKAMPDSMLDDVSHMPCADDIVNIQYTSGTTGKPKAVMTTQYSIVNNALVCGKNMNYSPEDRLLLCLPLFHVIGCVLSGILGILHGSTLVIVECFHTEEVLRALEKEKCTAINAVPTMFHFLLNSPHLHIEKLPALKKGFIAGSHCPPGLMTALMEKMHITEMSNVYGQTEGIAITQSLKSDSLDRRMHTIGRAVEGVEAKIIDSRTHELLPVGSCGELCVKTEYAMKGYYKNEDATKKTLDEEGWLHTGDLAEMDEDGYIKLLGRIKEIIIRGGENISPIEIENTLKDCHGVQDAAAVGVPDAVFGEEICAFIIRKDPLITEDELSTFASLHLAKYKLPKYYRFVNELPVTSSGKIKRTFLKEQVINEYR